MHLLILGAGALGSLLGARLSQTHARISLLSTDTQHMLAIQQHGLDVEELDGATRNYLLSSHRDPQTISNAADLVLVTVKSYDTDEAIASIKNCCHAATLFLTVQNGIGNWERIAHLTGSDRVLVGSTAQGATYLEPGRIRHGGNGPTFIGECRGPASLRVRTLVSLFQQAAMETHAADEMERLIWEKLVVNVGINAITALTGIRNGAIATQEMARELSATAVAEALAVAHARGIELEQDMIKRVHAIAQATSRNRSSMGQDVDRRKPTEIDGINGAIVKFGKETGVPTPVNNTLTQLVKIMEEGYAGSPQ